MRSLLIINFFHSSQEQVGSLRTRRFVHYLPRFGWSPLVLTKLPSDDSRRAPHQRDEGIHCVPSVPINRPFHLEVFTWIPLMLLKAVRILKAYPVSIVLISCPPFYPALMGILLKRWFHLKLVIDYRDAWTLNPYREIAGPFYQWISKTDRILEKFLIRSTDLLIVSHQTMMDRYLRRFPSLRTRVDVVYNGFDQEEIGMEQVSLFEKFTILHLGDFYAKQKTRDPTLFLSALQKFILQKQIPPGGIELLLLGERYRQIERTISRLGLTPYVSYRGRVPRPEAIECLKKSHLLLLIERMDVMTTKIFEYLATGKPILALVQEGEIKELINEYSKHSYAITSGDVDQIIAAIDDCFQNYTSRRFKPNESFLLNFNRESQTKRLAMGLERLVRSSVR